MIESNLADQDTRPASHADLGVSGRENWPALDGLRGFAIISVVLVHFWAHATGAGTGLPIRVSIGDTAFDMTWMFATSSSGVSIFFVLSGFLIYRHWLEAGAIPNRSLFVRQFYRRRLQRIGPAYVFFTAVYLLLAGVIGKHHFGAPLTPANIFLNLTFLSPVALWFGSNAASSLDIVPGTWSLNPEVWFYLAMPAVALLMRKMPAKWLVILALSLAAPVYREALGAAPSFILRFSLPGVADAFLFGMAAAIFSTGGWISKPAGLLFPLGAIWYIACCASVTPLRLDYASQVPAASALMIAGLVAPGNWPWKRWLSHHAIVKIGRISYSMFLCNVIVAWYVVLPVWQLCGFESASSRFVMNLILGVPLLYAISLASFKYIEAPFMSRARLAPNVMMRPAIAIAGAILLMSLVPVALVEARRGEGVGEFSGPAVQLTRWIVQSFQQHEGQTPIEIVGNPTVASETGHSSIHIERDKSGQVHVSSNSADVTNHWVAIMLPADINSITRGRLVTLTANLSIVRPSETEGCLGIFNGTEDVCTTRRALNSNGLLSIETRTAQHGPLQFKFNIFPNARLGSLDLTLSNLHIIEAD